MMNAIILDQAGVPKANVEVSDITASRITGKLNIETVDGELLNLLQQSKAAAEDQLFLEVDRIDQQITEYRFTVELANAGEISVRRLFLGDDSKLTIDIMRI